jgi:hypothetical protein
MVAVGVIVSVAVIVGVKDAVAVAVAVAVSVGVGVSEARNESWNDGLSEPSSQKIRSAAPAMSNTAETPMITGAFRAACWRFR